MSPEALDRMGKVTRMRERVRIAAMIEERAASLATETALYAFAEELRLEGVAVKLPTAEQVAQANELEAERVDAVVAQQEAEAGDALPAVHHMNDIEEGDAIVSNLAARRALNIGAGGAAGMRD